MLSVNNVTALAEACLTYIVGSRLHKISYDMAEYQKTEELSDQQIVVSQYDGTGLFTYTEPKELLLRSGISKSR